MLAWSAAALLALVAQTPAPPDAPLEMLVLPPKPEEGVKTDVAMQIWKSVVAEVDKAKATLGVSVRLQGEAKAALAGPAREQAWECRGEVPCLVELGNTLGASLLVAGSVDKAGVGFLVIDVRSGKKVVGAKSSKKLEKAGWQRQSKAAVKGVLSGVEQWRKAPPKPEAPPEVPMDPSVAEIRIATTELTGVRELTIDGLPIPFAGDSGVVWSGIPGRHVVVATRTDGTRAVHELTLEGGKSTAVVLVFVEPPTAPPEPARGTGAPPPSPVARGDEPPSEPAPALVAAPPPAADDEESATSQWWFWVAMGAALAAGGTTAAVLAGGIKGSVETDSGRGTITGTY